MQHIPLFIIALILSSPVLAKERNKEFCQTISQHKPNSDVAYKPGVDVRGNTVVPADVQDTGQYQIPDSIQIPIEIDVLEQMGIELDVPGLNLESDVGGIEVFRDGRVLYNGRDVHDNVQNFCQDGIEDGVEQPQPKDGHSPPDRIISGEDKDVLEGQFPPRKPKAPVNLKEKEAKTNE